MKMTLKISALLLLCAALLIMVWHTEITASLLHLFERLSPDGNVEMPDLYGWYIFALAVFLAGLGLLSLLCTRDAFRCKFSRRLKKFVNAVKSNPTQLIIASALGFVLTLLYFLGIKGNDILYSSFHKEDGLFETTTAVLFVMAAFAVAAAAFRLSKRGRLKKKTRTFHVALLLSIAALLFLVAMEEISWGQRIFQWNTPQKLSDINYQEELNLHNVFINPILGYLYPIAGILMALNLFTGWIAFSDSESYFFKWIFPRASLSILTLLILFSALINQNELTEVLASLFVMFYGIECIREIKLEE